MPCISIPMNENRVNARPRLSNLRATYSHILMRTNIIRDAFGVRLAIPMLTMPTSWLFHQLQFTSITFSAQAHIFRPEQGSLFCFVSTSIATHPSTLVSVYVPWRHWVEARLSLRLDYSRLEYPSAARKRGSRHHPIDDL